MRGGVLVRRVPPSTAAAEAVYGLLPMLRLYGGTPPGGRGGRDVDAHGGSADARSLRWSYFRSSACKESSSLGISEQFKGMMRTYLEVDVFIGHAFVESIILGGLLAVRRSPGELVHGLLLGSDSRCA